MSLSFRVRKIEARQKPTNEHGVVYVVNEEDDASTRESKRKAALTEIEQREGRELGDNVQYIQVVIVHRPARSGEAVEKEPAKEGPKVQPAIVEKVEPPRQQPEEPAPAMKEPDWPELKHLRRGKRFFGY